MGPFEHYRRQTFSPKLPLGILFIGPIILIPTHDVEFNPELNHDEDCYQERASGHHAKTRGEKHPDWDT
jgi:hypothetical protein